MTKPTLLITISYAASITRFHFPHMETNWWVVMACVSFMLLRHLQQALPGYSNHTVDGMSVSLFVNERKHSNASHSCYGFMTQL